MEVPPAVEGQDALKAQYDLSHKITDLLLVHKVDRVISVRGYAR